jgi:hypothetical protein
VQINLGLRRVCGRDTPRFNTALGSQSQCIRHDQLSPHQAKAVDQTSAAGPNLITALVPRMRLGVL